MSASVPARERSAKFNRIQDAALRIEEAVVCIARAIFMEGGTLVFGAHPSISPLVARVTDYYYQPPPAEESFHRETSWLNPSVEIYQSKVWREHWAASTERLTRHPLVKVYWIESDQNEHIDPDEWQRPQAPISMKKMRRKMIEETSPIAMIAIGGMEGVIEEARIFHECFPNRNIFTFKTTGGAASMLDQTDGLKESVIPIDEEAKELVRRFWNDVNQRSNESRDVQNREPRQENEYYIPYAHLAQKIVTTIMNKQDPNAEHSSFNAF